MFALDDTGCWKLDAEVAVTAEFNTNYFAGQGTLQSHHSPPPLSPFADVPPLVGSPEQLRNPNPIALPPVWHPRSLIPVLLLE